MANLSRLRAAAALVLAGLVGLSAPVTAQQGAMTRVDLELLLAVDISQSMDYDEHSIQRAGYVDAFRHKAFALTVSENRFMNDIRTFIFFYDFWDNFILHQIFHFIRNAGQGNKNGVFFFHPHSGSCSHLIVKNSTF